MALDHFDCCIIGAGVIGLAIGRQLAQSGRRILLLEQHPRYGSETSSRNSEVIHAGIYYPPGSLKATLCVAGKTALYQYCTDNHIEHRAIGKLIVAQQAQQQELHNLKQQAEANGVLDLQWLNRADIKRIEPQVEADLALYSPSTGIIDSHQLMHCLAAEIEANGGLIALNSRFIAAELLHQGYQVTLQTQGEPYRLNCQTLVNSAGLEATQVAHRIAGQTPHGIPSLHLCKGNYFILQGRSPFSHLIYPLPEPNTTGLGIHATLDLQGRTRFGPDIEYVQTPDHRVSEHSISTFTEAIQRYYPGLNPARLSPGYCGIRPKLQAPGEPAQDFLIQHPTAGLINLFGIESPGLTSCLAIAQHVQALIDTQP